MNLEETIKRLYLLSNYDVKKQLNEWGEVDSNGWTNIGIIPGGSPYGIGGDAYIMVDPNAKEEENISDFKYKHITYNTKPDGSGYSISAIPSYKLNDAQIYPEYKDSYYGECFLGKRKTDKDEMRHKYFMSKLNIMGNNVILKHDSPYRITDGEIKQGKQNSWSNNNDIGIYFWGSKKVGKDNSNGQQYTYICLAPIDEIYDFEVNLERYISLKSALREHRFCAQFWDDSEEAIAVNTLYPVKIQAIIDNRTGKKYDEEWNEIGTIQSENKKYKIMKVNESLHTLNKEDFRKLHHETLNENEQVMKRYYNIPTNRNKPILIEKVTLDRILKKHGSNGMINISANRSDMPKAYNDAKTSELIRKIQASGFSYLPTYGGYRDKKSGIEDDYEPSFVVFNYDAKTGEPRDFKELYDKAVEWCRDYDQHSVLIKAPNQNPIYVNGQGKKVNTHESDRYWKNDPKQEFFTSFKSKEAVDKEIREKLMGRYKSYCHKNNIPITKDGFEEYYNEHLNDIDTIGRRYTYDINFECYINPMPLQLSERLKRYGEIMIWQ